MDRAITSFSGNVNNIVSNWFVTSSLFKMDASSKQLHQAPVFGEDIYRCDLFALLRFEYQDRPYRTLAAIFTGEGGLRPIHFCQFVAGEA